MLGAFMDICGYVTNMFLIAYGRYENHRVDNSKLAENSEDKRGTRNLRQGDAK